MSTPVWVAVLRDLLLMGLGAAGLGNELLRKAEPNNTTVFICVGMILGSATLNLWWVGRNTSIAGQPSSSPPSSSSPPAESSSAG